MTNNLRFRMDFVHEIVSFDEHNRTIEFRLIPDPRRYEWKEIDGKEYLYDKLDNIAMLKEDFIKFISGMEGMPIYHQQQEVGNAEEYVKTRILEINKKINEAEQQPSFEDKSEEFLESLSKDKLGFVILCMDIADSTKMSLTLRPDEYAKLISIVLYEISKLIPKFHGHVLKYTGDGLIAYFPEPSFITKNDLALDCALTIKRLVYNGINQVFEEKGFPRIAIRIGMDSGDACVITIGSAETKQHKDIIGAVVSLAAKIQALGCNGDILLGDETLINLHTTWRAICEEVPAQQNWQYKKHDGSYYKVHRVKDKIINPDQEMTILYG